MIGPLDLVPPPGDEFLAQTDMTGERWHRFRLIALGDRGWMLVHPLSADPPPQRATLMKLRPIPPGYDPDGNLIVTGR